MLILLFIDSMPFRPLKVIYNLDLIKPINLLSFKMVVLESSIKTGSTSPKPYKPERCVGWYLVLHFVTINFVVFSFLFY